jgi:predicted aspartyl protease
MHLAAPLALVLLLSVTAGGQEKPARAAPPTADPIRVVLEKQGYVTIPLAQEGGGFVIDCKSGTETFLLDLDTGAEQSSLDLELVKKLGLKHEGTVEAAGIEGIRKSIEVSLRGLSIGDFDTRTMTNVIGIRGSDFTALNTDRDRRKLRRTDGLLGQALLDTSAAVIDYPTRKLYLRTPLAGLWPEVEGKWIAVSGRDDGQVRKIDPPAPPTLEFKDRRFHLTDGGKQYAFGLHVKPGANGGYMLGFFDPDQEFARKLNYRAVGLLKVNGDKLTVCLCLDLAKAKGLPDDFTAPAGSGHLLLEFRREKPRAGQPGGVDGPLWALLKAKGYVAVPLAREEGAGNFTVVCKSGTETLRLVLDTGAEVSTLDLGVVKKLGLKSKREVTAVGTTGTRDGVEVSLRGLSIGDFDTRATFNALPFAAIDFSAANAARVQHRKLRPIDGLLSHSTLKLYAAVIDLPTRTLYLRTPLDGLWPEIEGKWVAVSGREDGQERKIDLNAPPRLEFKDRGFHLTDGAKQYVYGLHVRPGKDRYAMALFDPEKEYATELSYKAGGLLTVAGDKLTVCLAFDPAKAKGKLPVDFKAPAGSGHVLLEFRREK